MSASRIVPILFFNRFELASIESAVHGSVQGKSPPPELGVHVESFETHIASMLIHAFGVA